jgi:hypothetical protein
VIELAHELGPIEQTLLTRGGAVAESDSQYRCRERVGQDHMEQSRLRATNARVRLTDF